jgi:hypothetical protein
MKRCVGIVCFGLLTALWGCDREAPGNVPVATPPSPPLPLSPYTYQPCDADSSTTVPPGVPSLPGGIWNGRLTNESLKATAPFTALVTEDGRFRFQTDNARIVGTVETGENTFTGDGLAYTWGDWPGFGAPSDFALAGTINERDSMAATWSMASGNAGCFEAGYDADTYEQPSSLQFVEGFWTEADGWGGSWTVTIEADGHVSWRDPYDDCDMTGEIALVDDRYNLYEVRHLISGCRPGDEEFTGLAYLSTSQDVLVLSIDNGANYFDHYWGR